MVKGDLPKLRAPEQPRVTSVVVDTFYRPQTRPVSQSVGELAQSLSSLNKSLSIYNMEKEETQRVDDIAQARVDFETSSNKAEFGKLIQEKVIPESASPYYINELTRLQLKQDGREFKQRIFDEWDKQNVFRDDEPLSFDKFFKTESQKFYNEKKIEGYNPATVAESLIPEVNAAYEELAQLNRSTKMKAIEDKQVDLLSKETLNLINDSLSFSDEQINNLLSDYSNAEGLTVVEKRILVASQLIQAEMDRLTSNHLNPSTANQTVVDIVTEYAKKTGDKDILAILNNIVTDKKSGSRLGKTKYAIEETLKTEYAIDDKVRTLEQYNFYKNERDKATLTDNIQLDILNSFKNEPSSILDFNEYINKYENENKTNIPPDVRVDLETFQEALINSFNDVDIIPDLELIGDINQSLIMNPREDGLFEKIIKGMKDNLIPQTQGLSMIEAFRQNYDLQGTLYIESDEFQMLSKSFKLELEDGFLPPAGDAKIGQAERAFKNYAFALIKDIESRDDGKLLTEKFEEFINKITIKQQNLQKILQQGFGQQLFFDNPTMQNLSEAIDRQSKLENTN